MLLADPRRPSHFARALPSKRERSGREEPRRLAGEILHLPEQACLGEIAKEVIQVVLPHRLRAASLPGDVPRVVRPGVQPRRCFVATLKATLLPSSGCEGWCASARGSIGGGVRGVRKRTFRNIISGKDFEAKKFVS